MKGLTENANEVMERLGDTESARNTAIAGSRAVIRSTKAVIHSIHLGKPDMEAVGTMDRLMADLISSVRNSPEILCGPAAEDAMMEFAEARLFLAVYGKKELPSYQVLGISPKAWAMGLCDVLGEMRRLLLTHLMSSDLGKAKDLFSDMEEISDAIMLFDVPDAVAPIRRKQDIARGIMEKTRSDLATAIAASRMKL